MIWKREYWKNPVRIANNNNNKNGIDLWDNIKYTNIHIIVVPGGEEGQKEAESLFKEIMTETFPNLGSDTSRYIKFIGYADSTQRELCQNTLQHITIKLSRIKKDKNLKTLSKCRKNDQK